MFFGGIEGGATHSKLVICNEAGEIVASVAGPSTNHWMLGIPECANRIASMVTEGKNEAGIPQATHLKSMGLSLSGCEQVSTNRSLEAEMRLSHPSVAENYYVCSDTVGSVYTASPLGGLVLIAGTGSNALLRNPDGQTYSCGGWGNMIADEGSAWWIAFRCVKIVFDHMDGLVVSPYDVEPVWQIIQNHFGVDNRADLLEYCYGKFQKCFFASMCVQLAEAAHQGDKLCASIFKDAGRFLAKATAALLPRVSHELTKDGYLHIVCVGSVWKSWPLLCDGYISEIAIAQPAYGLKLVKLTQHMALGAVYIGADAIQFDLPRDYSKNVEVFHHYVGSAKTNGTSQHSHATLIITKQ